MPWNFAKFLVDRNGNVVKFYMSDIEPLSIKDDIKELLKWSLLEGKKMTFIQQIFEWNDNYFS